MKNQYTTENTLPAFTNTADRQIALLIKNAYETCFQGTETENKNIPDILNVIEKTESFLFFFSYKILYLPRLLTPQELQLSHFQDQSETFNKSINRKFIQSILCTGMDYIQKIENNFLFRKPYEKIHNILYYCIYIILKIAKNLSQVPISQELIEDYKRLDNFLSEALFIFNNHAKTKNNIQFNYFLYESQEKIVIMKKRTEFYYERNSISSILLSTINLLEAYRSELSAFIFYSFSEFRNSENFDASYLDEENDQRLDRNYINSQAYINLRAAYTNHENIENLQKINHKSTGVSKFIKKFDEYNNLFKLLYNFSFLIKNIILLHENSILDGEWDTARDETLNLILKINLKLLIEYIQETSKNIDEVKNLSTICARNNSSVSAEFKSNSYYASKKILVIEKIKKHILSSNVQIKARVKNIRQLDPRVKQVMRDGLINNTEVLINRIESKTILSPEVTERLVTKMSKNKEKIVQKNSTSIIEDIKTKNYSLSFSDLYKNIEKDKESKKMFHEEVKHFDIGIDNTFSGFKQINEVKKKLILWINEEIEKNNEKNIETLLSAIKFCSEKETDQEKKHSTELLDLQNNRQNNIKKILEKMPTFTKKEVLKFMGHVKSEFSRKLTLLKNHTAFMKDLLHASVTDRQSVEKHYESMVRKCLEKKGIQRAILGDCHGELLVISVQLLGANHLEDIQTTLVLFFKKLFDINYKIGFFGGEAIEQNKIVKKVPKNIKAMFDIYGGNLKKINTLENAMQIRKTIFDTPKSAADKKQGFFSFFNSRHVGTQQIYDIMSAAHQRYTECV